MNFFELFGLTPSFHPDKKLVAKRYVELQKKYHPDFFTQSGGMEQEEALELSSQVNRGYKTLLDQDATIKYILQLHELIEEEEKYQLSPGFLMEMMELNEAVMEGDAGVAEKLDHLNKESYEMVKADMENYQGAAAPKEGLLRIKEYYYQKKYLNRIREQISGMS